MRRCLVLVLTIGGQAVATGCGGAASDQEPAAAAVRPQALRHAELIASELTAGKSRLIKLRVDGSRSRVVRLAAPVPPQVLDGSWSPDGRRLVVTGLLGERRGDRFTSIATDVWVTAADGKKARRLTRAEDAGSPVFTPDGSALIVTRAPAPRRESPDGPPKTTGTLWRIPLDGSPPSVLVARRHDGADLAGAFSPDGQQLVFTRCQPLPDAPRYPQPITCAVYLARADGTALRKLADRAGGPDWSPDGRWIIFASDRDETAEITTGEDETAYASELYRLHPDGTGLERLTRTPSLSEAAPRYSPSGTLIAYTRRNTFDFATGLVVSNSNGTCPRAITGTPGRWIRNPAWRPGVTSDETLIRC